MASVETKLLYENDTDAPIEATFTFPIDDNSAVYDFEVLIDGQLIVGECQDKKQVNKRLIRSYNDIRFNVQFQRLISKITFP